MLVKVRSKDTATAGGGCGSVTVLYTLPTELQIQFANCTHSSVGMVNKKKIKTRTQLYLGSASSVFIYWIRFYSEFLAFLFESFLQLLIIHVLIIIEFSNGINYTAL